MATEPVNETNAVGVSVAALSLVIAMVVKELSDSKSIDNSRLKNALNDLEQTLLADNPKTVALEIVGLIKDQIHE